MRDMNSLRQKPPISADQTMYTERGPLRLPMDLREWFSEDNLVAWIKEAVENLHKEHAEVKEPTGRAKSLIAVISLACITQTLLSDDIVRVCRSEKAFIELCGPDAPFRQELEQFRRQNRPLLELALTAVLLRAVRQRYSSLEKLPPGLEFAVKTRAIDRLDTIRNMDTWDE
jgi:hypothetical protein